MPNLYSQFNCIRHAIKYTRLVLAKETGGLWDGSPQTPDQISIGVRTPPSLVDTPMPSQTECRRDYGSRALRRLISRREQARSSRGSRKRPVAHAADAEANYRTTLCRSDGRSACCGDGGGGGGTATQSMISSFV